jgi:hypothetical protein
MHRQRCYLKAELNALCYSCQDFIDSRRFTTRLNTDKEGISRC